MSAWKIRWKQSKGNLGLRLIETPEIDAQEGDELEVMSDKVENKTTGKSFKIAPMPKSRQAIIDAGGASLLIRGSVF